MSLGLNIQIFISCLLPSYPFLLYLPKVVLKLSMFPFYFRYKYYKIHNGTFQNPSDLVYYINGNPHLQDVIPNLP